jgi:uncharacterized protein
MKPILAYVATAFGLSIALSLVIGLTGGSQSRLIGLASLSMVVPTLAVAVAHFTTNEAPQIRWDRFAPRYLPVALFLIPGVLHAVMLPLMAIAGGGLHWQVWLTPGPNGLYDTPLSRGWGTVSIQELVGHIVLNAIVGLIVVSFLAFFEEVGWRAWLLPRLRARMSARRAVVITSIVWALWHIPFELSGIMHIDGVSPLKLALTVPFGTFSAGLILGWLWLRTESIWLVAIAHGALNNWGQYAFKYMENSGMPDRDLAVLSAGSLALFAVGLVLLSRFEAGERAAK